jgi:hypothetical protein
MAAIGMNVIVLFFNVADFEEFLAVMTKESKDAIKECIPNDLTRNGVDPQHVGIVASSSNTSLSSMADSLSTATMGLSWSRKPENHYAPAVPSKLHHAINASDHDAASVSSRGSNGGAASPSPSLSPVPSVGTIKSKTSQRKSLEDNLPSARNTQNGGLHVAPSTSTTPFMPTVHNSAAAANKGTQRLLASTEDASSPTNTGLDLTDVHVDGLVDVGVSRTSAEPVRAASRTTSAPSASLSPRLSSSKPVSILSNRISPVLLGKAGPAGMIPLESDDPDHPDVLAATASTPTSDAATMSLP